jgi:hypothetical protein
MSPLLVLLHWWAAAVLLSTLAWLLLPLWAATRLVSSPLLAFPPAAGMPSVLACVTARLALVLRLVLALSAMLPVVLLLLSDVVLLSLTWLTSALGFASPRGGAALSGGGVAVAFAGGVIAALLSGGCARVSALLLVRGGGFVRPRHNRGHCRGYGFVSRPRHNKRGGLLRGGDRVCDCGRFRGGEQRGCGVVAQAERRAAGGEAD